MATVKIISDSTCDLSPELIEKYNIDIVPLYINLDGRVLRDGMDVKPEDIFASVEKTGVLPGTIAASVTDFKEIFEKYRNNGCEIVCHTISSEMSSSNQNAKIAADEVGGVWVVDSRNLSTGVGHVVINSALMAQQGMSASSIAKALESEIIPKVRSSFILGDMDYMKKGGRCSGVAALGANLLKIKPTIIVENGRMKVGHKFRGTLPKVLGEYVDMQLKGRSDIRPELIFITHTGCSREIVDGVAARIKADYPFEQIIETRAGSTITSHCGQNTLGVLFIEK